LLKTKLAPIESQEWLSYKLRSSDQAKNFI